jgi:lactoylglutathione lyase
MASYTAVSKSSPQNFSWQQTMLRIKDPKVTLPFYQEHFGFKLIRDLHFPEWKFSLYFWAFHVMENHILSLVGCQ